MPGDAGPESGPNQPIAIIGFGCRFPGGSNSPGKFWQLLKNGTDAIGNVPPDRWSLQKFYDPDPEEPGKIYARCGGFIEGFDQFDAPFFGISPREASRMDPQQRLLLEVAYHALEDAGLQLERLAGSRTGVFVGISTYDYGATQGQPTEARLVDGYTNLGGALSIAAARISYAFDLKGPCLSVDTACSSSLVGTHLACQSIWRNESDLALVGGVNVLLNQAQTMGFSKASMLSPDGRCKPFDARANGYVRGEGAGVVVLKPLNQAIQDQDPIYAIVKATAVNQDGRSGSLPVPSRSAQEEMLREAYRQAGVDPNQVQYVEAHGTGTPVGDPIEAKALGSVLGHGRPAESPCAIGSVKSNIGHLEAGSGVAGIMKAALCLKHSEIPPTLHFREPNPEIPFEDLGLRVVDRIEPWPEAGSGPRLAAVNSFGFGGTNAHVVLQEAPPVENLLRPPLDEGPVLLSLSARSREALEALSDDYRRCLRDGWAGDDVALSSVCRAAGLRRSHHDFRLAIAASSKQAVSEQLAAFAAGEQRPTLSSGRRRASREPQVAFVFSGMGPQWWAMGRQLLEEEPVFREALRECESLLRPLSGWSLLEELSAPEEKSRVQQTRIAQPAIFALQVGLASLWKSWGVQPAAVVGHSVGEVAAAHVAGALNLGDAVELIYHRSRLQHGIEGQGRMLAVGLSLQETEKYLDGREALVSIAAVNSPETTTLSGDVRALKEINRLVEKQGAFARFLSVEVPYHSPGMDPIRDELMKSLRDLSPGPTSCTLVSSALGRSVAGQELGPEYWWKNVRDPVLFAEATTRLLESGCDLFLEISAHPVLTVSISDSAAAAGGEATTAYSLRRGEPERTTMLGNLGKLYTLGHPVDWSLLYPEPRSPVKLPHYPWQRERYWAETDDSLRWRLGSEWHPLLGEPLHTARPTWSATLSAQSPRYLRDHGVQGAVVYPAAAFVEMALSAARSSLGEGSIILEEVHLKRALVLKKSEASKVQLALDRQDSSFEISSRSEGAGMDWELNATGSLRLDADSAAGEAVDLEDIRHRCPTELSASDFYVQMREAGLEYGPEFSRIRRIWSGEGEGLAEIRGLEPETGSSEAYLLHPTVLDACLQVSFCTLDVQGTLYLPVFLEKFTFYARPGRSIWCHARIANLGEDSLEVDLQILDESGNRLAELRGGRCRALGRDPFRRGGAQDLHYTYQWIVPAGDEPPGVRRSTFLPAPGELDEVLQTRLEGWSADLGRVHHYEKVSPALNDLLATFALRAFDRLGWRPDGGERVSGSHLMQTLKISPDKRSLLLGLLELLQGTGVLLESTEGWDLGPLPDAEDPRSKWRHLLGRYPAYLAELTLLGRYGSGLARLLRGEADELDVLCPQGFRTAVDHFFQDAPSNQIYNHLLAGAVAESLRGLPRGRKARLLELGSSLGLAVSFVRSQLPPDQIEHTLISISEDPDSATPLPGSAPAGEERTLDLDESLIEQGLSDASLDLLVLPTGLCLSGRPEADLERIRRLLKPGGLLIGLEATRQTPWRNLLMGALGRRRFPPDTAPKTLSPGQSISRDLLEAAGFGQVTSLTERVAEPERLLLLASNRPDAESPGTRTPVEDTLTPGESWLIFSDSSTLSEKLAAVLRKRRQTPILLEAGSKFEVIDRERFRIPPGEEDDIRAAVDAVAASASPCRGIVHLWSLLSPPGRSMTASSLQQAQTTSCVSLLQLVQALEKVDWLGSPELLVVSRGANSVGGTPAESIAATPLWGFTRVLMNEHPNLHTRLLDLNPDPEAHEAETLMTEWERKDGEDEIAFRSGTRYVHRLVRLSNAGGAKKQPESDLEQRTELVRAEIGTPGILDSLRFVATPRQSPGRGQVEIEVGASALNFKDIAKAMGLLGEMTLEGTASGRSLGLECAGTITAVGKAVGGFQEGDRVVGFAAGTLGTHALADVRLVGHLPAQLSEEAAATLMTVSMTAHYALNHLAKIGAGERILIHAASGGVGLAAIQLARTAGAEVFATAGNPEKRSFLRLLGVSHVMDSRSLSFADRILELTDGKGVDVVLNSLSGEALTRSLAVVAPFGRFIEIGKRDIEENHRLGLRPFQNNLSFFSADLDRISLQRPELAAGLFREILDLVADGSLSPLPYRVFPATRLVDAFRYMATARHIGKIVISMAGTRSLASSPEQPLELHSEATYLITGGLSGFGFATAYWLAGRGARHLVLMGRSGVSGNEAREGIASLRQKGVEVVVEAADVTDESQVGSVLDRIRNSMPPLRGVIHSAMVLEDATVLQQSPEQLNRVLAPKMTGAWNLHTQTRSDPLDFFVMYSSFASLFGNPGQSNYAAANAFLDALANWRKDRGLPALTVNWGAIADVGVVARSSELQRHFSRLGIEPLRTARALAILGQLLQGTSARAGVSPPLLWSRLSQFFPTVNSPRFSSLVGTSESTVEEESDSIRDALLGAQPEESQEILESHLRETLAAVIGTSPGKVDLDQPLLDLGLDSLMAVEMITRIRGSLGVEVPAMKFVEGINLRELSSYLIAQLSETGTSPES